MTQKIEAEREKRVHQIVGGIEQQRDTFRVFGVNRKIECLLRLDPCNTERQRATFRLLPSWAIHECNPRLNCVRLTTRAIKHHLG